MRKIIKLAGVTEQDVLDYINMLYAEIDERDKRIAALEEQNSVKDKKIAELSRREFSTNIYVAPRSGLIVVTDEKGCPYATIARRGGKLVHEKLHLAENHETVRL